MARGRMSLCGASVLFTLALAATSRAESGSLPRLGFETRESRLTITADKTPIGSYVYQDEAIRRPYFEHLMAPGGIQATRTNPPVEGRDAIDHATFHPGLWLAFGDLSGADNWRNQARVVHDSFVEPPHLLDTPHAVAFSVRNRYLAGSGHETLCHELCRYTVYARTGGFLWVCDSTFEPAAGDLSFGDQEEMGLGVRVATPLAVASGGTIQDSEGRQNEREVWGHTAAWCDYSGPVGDRRAGVTLMPDPANFRPGWFHARDYGLLVANPFGRKAMTGGEASRVVVRPGGRLQLRFGVLVHAEARDERPNLAAAYHDFVALLAAADGPSAVVQQEFVFENAPFRSCHASTIAETPGGLLAAWFGGTDEGNRDVGIWLARREQRGWSQPVEVASGQAAAGERWPCWNPVLFQAPGGPLLLFYKVGPSPSRWWGVLRTSTDGGRTWSEPTRLPDGFLGPVKDKPILLADGTLLCPSSTEDRGWRLHVERTPDLGRTWTKTEPLNDGKALGLIQPTILVHRNATLELLCRSKQGRIAQAFSTDNGKTWSAPSLTELPNPNSGIDAVTLRDGRFLLVYNHTARGRSPLNVAVSTDGMGWQAGPVLESEPGEYSYPAVIQAADGRVHVTYTWKRRRIRHVVLDPGGLAARPVDGTRP